MSATRIVCLANSYKEGGRCVAGIELDNQNNPVKINGRPKWIRPVCSTAHGEIPTYVVEWFHLLNILEFENTGSRSHGYQSENVSFNENTIRSIGGFDSQQLKNLCDNHEMIFGSKGKAVSREHITALNHSLLLLSVNEFKLTQQKHEDEPDDRPQTRLVFMHNSHEYNLPVTDPIIRSRFKKNPAFLDGVNHLYLCVSLGIEHVGWHYKLVAGIIKA